ncbi:MAG: type II CRISPR RNA-guided endonuclease Cas9, partial [Flavobacteriaceae bacterium]
GGSIVLGHKLLTLEAYESHVNTYFKNNKAKLKNLLSEDIPEGFINRQLNDSRYISKLVKGLLSNIVREDGEREATSKKLIPVTGSVTSKLKHDWGLHDKWNEIVAPRFKRLNELKNTDEFGYWDSKINAFRIQVPDELSKGFSTKRIDHRHHALDALVVACTARNHTHYLSALNAENKNYGLRGKLLIKNDKGDYTKTMQMPWQNFPTEAKKQIERIVVSFKQNLRVINKTNNKFWSYTDENGNLNLGKDGKPKKKLRKQTKGDNWAIRKALHDPMPYGKITLDFDVLDISKGIGKRELIIDANIRLKVEEAFISNNKNIGQTQKYLKTNPIIDEFGNKIEKTHFKIKSEKYGKRQPINKLNDKKYEGVLKGIHKVGDYNLQLELVNHLNRFREKPEEAFSPEGIDTFNEKRKEVGKTPVYKLRFCETGSKRFQLGDKIGNNHKQMEATDGTNLFFAIYWDEKKQKRNFETVPLNEVIAHQKQVAHLPKEERMPIQPNVKNGIYLFSLSPNDLVYVPTDEEMENPSLVDVTKLNVEQIKRVYKMVSSSGNQCFFILANVSRVIENKVEYSALNKMERAIDEVMIKERCWKLEVNKLGNITKVIK